MSHQLTELVIIHHEPIFRQRVLPKFSGIVEENSREQQIEVQLGVKRRDPLRHAHHLCSMLDESAPAGVMIFSRGCRAAEPVAPFIKKGFTQRAQPWIGNPRDSFLHEFKIGRLLSA